MMFTKDNVTLPLADYILAAMALRSISSIISEINCRRVFDISNKRPISGLTDWIPKEVETHTGQKWDKEDYRLCRFVDRTKLVNPNWGIKLIAEAPPQAVKGRVTSCDGGGGPTGHPRVFINLDKPGNHSCLYCGLRFYKDDHGH